MEIKINLDKSELLWPISYPIRFVTWLYINWKNIDREIFALAASILSIYALAGSAIIAVSLWNGWSILLLAGVWFFGFLTIKFTKIATGY